MKRQEMFTDGLNALRKQGKASLAYDEYDDKFFCRYRDEEGCKCLIGHLIPDDLYTSSIESRSVLSRDVWSKIGLKYEIPTHLTEEESSFLENLQTLHDFAAIINDDDDDDQIIANDDLFLSKLEAFAEAFAKQYGLVYEPSK